MQQITDSITFDRYNMLHTCSGFTMHFCIFTISTFVYKLFTAVFDIFILGNISAINQYLFESVNSVQHKTTWTMNFLMWTGTTLLIILFQHDCFMALLSFHYTVFVYFCNWSNHNNIIIKTWSFPIVIAVCIKLTAYHNLSGRASVETEYKNWIQFPSSSVSNSSFKFIRSSV